MEDKRLIQIEKSVLALSAARSIEEVKIIRDKAEAIRILMRQQSGCLESQNTAAELKLRAERKLGHLLDGTVEPHRPSELSHHGTVLPEGINRNQSSRWQREAKVSEEKFENYLNNQREKLLEITSVGLLQLAEAGTQGHVSIDRNWYTPEIYIEMAREVMGGIDLDPASDEEAQKVVKAERFYDKEADGLQQTWQGRIWLNPPWSDPQPWLKKLVAEKVDQAIVLTTNATETEWFQDMIPQAYVVSFPRGRIKCYGHDNGSSPLRGQAFFYLGNYSSSFQDIFGEIGRIWVVEK